MQANRSYPERMPRYVSRPIMHPFESGHLRAQWATILFAILGVVSLILIVSTFAELGLIQKLIDGQHVSQSDLDASDDRQRLINGMLLLFYFVSAVVFLMWIHRAHRNLPSLHARGLRFSPGWAIGWFFVPIFSLFRPYQVMSEIWRGSDPDTDPKNATAWENSPVSPLVGWWWALFLASMIVGNVVLRLAFNAEEPSSLIYTQTEYLNYLKDYRTQDYMYIMGHCIDIVGIVLVIGLVRAVDQRQQRRYAKLTSLSAIVSEGEKATFTGADGGELNCCPQCGKGVPPNWRFCFHCGLDLTDAQMQSSLQSRGMAGSEAATDQSESTGTESESLLQPFSCPHCRIPADRDWEFCPNCGENLIEKRRT
ncbi:MAG: DUF4328 domain-containing protein [Dehalococcoidia bacterium]|nr:DUF4328 domain-containing protein [Dehalococcoidia bacterium]